MQRERLTPERIRRFQPSGSTKQAFLWDIEAPRLAVRATAGAKSFIFESKLNRRTIRMTIGDVRAWTLEDVRAEARRLQTLVDQEVDPRQEKAERIAASEAKRADERRAAAPAMEAWSDYIEARASSWSERHRRNHDQAASAGGKLKTRGRRPGEGCMTMPGPLYALLLLPLGGITPDAVRDWLEQNNSHRPTYTAQCYRALRAFIGWCASQAKYRGIVHADACTASETRRKVAKLQVKNDCLQREMLQSWFQQVRALPNSVQSAYLQTLLLTGARREELAGLRWDDVDFQWMSLTIRDKVDGVRHIPLTPYVAALLSDLKRRSATPPPQWRILNGRRIQNDLESWAPSGWVFASRLSASGRIQEPRIAHNKALIAAGLPSLTLHGLRRSFGTLAEWVEVPTGVVAQIMGHKPSALAEKHYRRRPLDLLRMWHVKVESWMLEQARVELPRYEQAGSGLRVVG